jgi:hypothetical protein
MKALVLKTKEIGLEKRGRNKTGLKYTVLSSNTFV